MTLERDDARAETEGLGQVVRHHHDGQVVLVPDAADQNVDVGPDAGIERAEWLIEQEDLRAGG